MSADKHRSRARRLILLRMAGDYQRTASSRPGIMLNHEGGMAMDNPDLQRLLANGLLRLRRQNAMGFPLPSKKFLGAFGKAFGTSFGGRSLHGETNRTFAVITPAGIAALRAGRA